MSSSDLPLNGERLAFTNFAKLPPELLFMVWKEAAHVPQLISLEYEAARDNFKGNHIRCPLLRVNKEARREVLRYKKDLDVSEGWPWTIRCLSTYFVSFTHIFIRQNTSSS
jgi:hypothetical protein